MLPSRRADECVVDGAARDPKRGKVHAKLGRLLFAEEPGRWKVASQQAEGICWRTTQASRQPLRTEYASNHACPA
jgi:hypothetical protein